MFLNLDLLYNVNTYLFPLFYYKNFDRSEVYSPMTLKSISTFHYDTLYYDHITSTYKRDNYNHIYKYTYYKRFTEEYIICSGIYIERREPFELSKEHISFLKSNKRIN